MDQCPQHIEGDLWRSSCLLRIQVRNRGLLANKLVEIKEAVKEKNENGKNEAEETGGTYIPLVVAEKEGDPGYEEKSQLKSLDLQISEKITSWASGNAA